MDRSKVGTRAPRTYTKEMDKWIRENKDVMIYRNQKHFTDLFNAIHGTSITTDQMNQHLHRIGVQVLTSNNVAHYTEEQDKWLCENYDRYNNDWVALANDFNKVFGTDYSNCRLAKHCERRLKIHNPIKKEKGTKLNKGSFTVGNDKVSTKRQLPLGTIRIYTTKTCKMPMIKVKLTEGDSGSLRGNGHNMKRPWWIPLKEKVWIDAYGEIPEGYRIVNLDGNTQNCELNNLALADARGLAIMGSHKWWSDNPKFTATAIEWCNLYITAKDKGVYEK